uniref:DUF1758 domain-containing protein n=1 Tax=Meloidogyne enterolobii TaxID=390850 RepID=A0A6V7W9N7_MELEN|nr:unnamed protein product [Meloidogyne enterolobii]
MSAPIKSTIVSSMRALARLRTVKELNEEILEEDNLETQFLKVEALVEKIESEITTGEAYLNDIRSAMAQYVDLLRKLSGDERKQANEDFEKFQAEQKLDRAMETIELMLRNLRDHHSSTAIKMKLLASRVEKEKRNEELIHAQLLQASPPRQESSSSAATRQTISSIYQLPTLQIKRFNGERKDWLEFYESFRCAVDSSAGSDIEKLTLLRNLVDGEPRELIAGFRLEAKNYKEALQLLKDQYGDRDAHIRNLHSRLANLKICSTLSDVRKFSLDLERLAREMKNMGEDIEGPAVHLMLEKKLNKPFLRTILTKKAEDPSNWSTNKFRSALLEALQKEVAIQEVMNEYDQEHYKRQPKPNQQVQQNHQKSPPQYQHEYTYAAISEGQRQTTQRTQIQQSRQATRGQENQWGFNNTRQQVNNRALLPECIFCGLKHWNDKCNKYNNPQARLQIAKEKKLCTHCLRRNHSSAECKTPAKCYYCKSWHPTALCFQRNPNLVPIARRQENMVRTQQRDEPIATNCQIEQSNAIENKEFKALLMAIEAPIYNPVKPLIIQRALIFIDPGSQRSFISAKLADALNLPIVLANETCRLTSFGERMAKEYKSDLVRANLQTERGGKLSIVLNKLSFLVNPLPHYDLKELTNEELNQLRLTTNVEYRQPDLLIGMDLFHELKVEKKATLPSGFTITESRLGQLLSGAGQIEQIISAHTIYAASVQVNTDLNCDDNSPKGNLTNHNLASDNWPSNISTKDKSTSINAPSDKLPSDNFPINKMTNNDMPFNNLPNDNLPCDILPSETPSKNISPNNWTNNNSPNDKSPRNCLPKDRILSVNSPKDNSTNDNRPNDNLPNGKWANDNSSIAEIIKSPKSLKKGRVLKPIEDLAPIQEEITILAIIRNQLEVNYNWDTDVSNEIKEIWLTIMACWKFRKKKAHMEEVQKDRSATNDHYNSDNCNKSASQSARPHIQTPTDDL